LIGIWHILRYRSNRVPAYECSINRYAFIREISFPELLPYFILSKNDLVVLFEFRKRISLKNADIGRKIDGLSLLRDLYWGKRTQIALKQRKLRLETTSEYVQNVRILPCYQIEMAFVYDRNVQ